MSEKLGSANSSTETFTQEDVDFLTQNGIDAGDSPSITPEPLSAEDVENFDGDVVAGEIIESSTSETEAVQQSPESSSMADRIDRFVNRLNTVSTWLRERKESGDSKYEPKHRAERQDFREVAKATLVKLGRGALEISAKAAHVGAEKVVAGASKAGEVIGDGFIKGMEKTAVGLDAFDAKVAARKARKDQDKAFASYEDNITTTQAREQDEAFDSYAENVTATQKREQDEAFATYEENVTATQKREQDEAFDSYADNITATKKREQDEVFASYEGNVTATQEREEQERIEMIMEYLRAKRAAEERRNQRRAKWRARLEKVRSSVEKGGRWMKVRGKAARIALNSYRTAVNETKQ